MSASSLVIPESLIPYLTGQLTDYRSLRDAVVKCNIVFITLVIVSSGLRMFVRFWLLHAAGFDDALMILAVVFAMVLFVSSLVAAHYGIGVHIWNLDSNLLNLPDEASRLVKILFVCYIAYSSAITFTKCSIIASYLRIFPDRKLRIVMFVIGFVVISSWITSIFAITFTCVPVQAAWDFNIQGKCFPVVTYFYASAGFNIATDITLCVAPMPLLWAMNLPRQQRFIVCVLFSIGLFACVASILRLTQLNQLRAADLSYESASSLNWSTAEVGTAILCTSLSALRPLASRLFPEFFRNLTRNAGTYDTSVPSETRPNTSEHQVELPIMPPDAIHVRHSYEVRELGVLPQKAGRMDPNRIYNMPFDGRSSKEQLVGLS